MKIKKNRKWTRFWPLFFYYYYYDYGYHIKCIWLSYIYAMNAPEMDCFSIVVYYFLSMIMNILIKWLTSIWYGEIFKFVFFFFDETVENLKLPTILLDCCFSLFQFHFVSNDLIVGYFVLSMIMSILNEWLISILYVKITNIFLAHALVHFMRLLLGLSRCQA